MTSDELKALKDLAMVFRSRVGAAEAVKCHAYLVAMTVLEGAGYQWSPAGDLVRLGVLVITHKRQIIEYIATAAESGELKDVAAELSDEWDEVARELVKEIQRAKHPPYGQDWGPWLKANLDELTQEAIDIVM